MKKHYKKEFLPYGLASGYCSLTVLAGLLNYFFNTNFSSKDNFDLLGLANRGRRNRSDLLSLEQIALFLDRLYLDITIHTSLSKEDRDSLCNGSPDTKIEIIKKSINKEFHHNIIDGKWQFEDGSTVDLFDDLLDQRLIDSNISWGCNTSADDAMQIMQEHQGDGVMFVLGCNRGILHEGSSHTKDGEGHVVICSGINEKNECIIHEPNYPRPNPHHIHIDRVKKAMTDLGNIEMIEIKDNATHI